MTNDIDNDVVQELNTIKNLCDNRKHNCKDCQLSNMNNECLIYEYPYLWKIKHKKVIKLLE